MLHLMKYRFRLCIRDRSSMFWGLFFPVLLSTLFYFTLMQGGQDSAALDPVPVALVQADDSDAATQFCEFIEALDGDTLEVRSMSREAADHALMTGKVTGIFTAGESCSLSVAGNDIEESVLKSLLSGYNRTADTLSQIAADHPEALTLAPDLLAESSDMTETVTLGGKSMDGNMQYFFALIAMTCLYGCFLGMDAALESKADLSPVGIRRSITPTHRLKLILSDMLVTFFVQFINLMLLLFFLQYVLGLSLGGHLEGMVLVCIMGSMLGVSLGILVGSLGSFPEGLKIAVLVSVCLVLSFLAGLMVGDMKDIIEQNIPLLNRINPAAVISDALYCLAIYEAPARFRTDLLILGAMTVLFVIFSFTAVRRERYDSI